MTLDVFWDKVSPEPNTGCWLWTGAVNGHRDVHGGYGHLTIYKKYVSAHRLSYVLCKAGIPDGLTLDHLCKNRLCVNPAHLEPVSLKENILRGSGASARNARKVSCSKGHPLSGENLYIHPTGGRRCRICNYWQVRLRREKMFTLKKAQ